MSHAVHLGLDVGGTASRWVACDNHGDVLTRGRAAGATGHVFNPAEEARLRAVLQTIAGDLAAAGLRAGSVAAGLTGYGSAVAGEVAALLHETLGVAPDQALIVDDMSLAYAANFAPGEGHLVSAGTGSIGLHVGLEESVRVGGRGILIDDAGSGSWITLRALDLVYRNFDQTGSFADVSALADRLFAAIGGNSWSDVRQYIYGGDRGRIGALAVAVGDAAEEGDGLALAILRDAALELAQLGLALSQRVGRRPIGYIGGVLTLHPVVGEGIRNFLDGHDVRFLAADAPLMAARLRLDVAPMTLWRQLLAKGPGSR